MQQETIDIKVLKHQMAFINSNATHTGLVAGFGSGKSIAATLKTIEKKKLYPGINVAYYLPTYPLVKDIAFPNFEYWLSLMDIPYELNRSDKEFITPLGKIILRTMDNPALIVGYEVGYSLIDEADILPLDKMRDVFVKIIARNRKVLPDGAVNSIDLVSTPEGFNFMYDFFMKSNSDNRKLIKAKTQDNPYLPASYIDTLKEIYTEEQLQAYLEGEFVNLTSGSVYRNFDRKLNDTTKFVGPHDVLHIGMDFNITNMNAVVHIIDGLNPVAVDEFTKVYDTPEMIDVIKRRYPGYKIVVYPDASGGSRSTSGKSDIALLKDAGFTVRNRSKNPAIRDRVNALNIAMLNNKGERRYKVNTSSCPVFTEALEQQTYKNGAPDKQGGFDHINEAGGYMVYYHYHKPSTTRIKRATLL